MEHRRFQSFFKAVWEYQKIHSKQAGKIINKLERKKCLAQDEASS